MGLWQVWTIRAIDSREDRICAMGFRFRRVKVACEICEEYAIAEAAIPIPHVEGPLADSKGGTEMRYSSATYPSSVFQKWWKHRPLGR